MIKYGIILFVFSELLIPSSLTAQLYVEGGKTRHRFAQMHIGLQANQFVDKGNTQVLHSNGQWMEAGYGGPAETKLIVGGTHFWGHADFYITFPIFRFGNKEFTSGIETAARVYPWPISKRKIRPFAGFGHTSAQYHMGDGAHAVRQRLLLNLGLSFQSGNHLWDIHFNYLPHNTQNYFFSRVLSATVKTPRSAVGISYRYLFDTTVSAEKNWLSGRTKILTDTLAKLGRLDGWTLSAGPSVAFYLNRSERMKTDFAFLVRAGASNLMADIGIGYYWHKPDLQVNLAFRSVQDKLEAYAYSQKLDRKSLALETYAFFADYHGFAPFAGVALSYEWLNVKEFEGETEVVKGTYNGLKPGLILGWDIRPNRIQSFYLRTNLRWFPNLNVNLSDGGQVRMDQLEVNFIQLVVFPGRMF